MDSLYDAVMNDAGIIFVVGSIKSGKTATMFRLVELMHKVKPLRIVCIYAVVPESRYRLRELLPEWINIVDTLDFRELPVGAIILGDEGTVYANSKNYAKGEMAVKLASDLATVRHRGQTFIGCIQELALLQKDYMRMGVTLAVKWINPLSLELERTEYVSTLKTIMRKMEGSYLPNIKLVYLLNGVDGGMYEIDVPSFWSDDLSVLWGNKIVMEVNKNVVLQEGIRV